MRPTDKVLAVACSDLHLWHVPPSGRAEPDWMAAQERVLDEIRDLRDEYKCPLVYAGDIFHNWNPPPSLVNWTAANLPQGYAVPGQHDLRHHNLDDIASTAYWTLVMIGTLKDLTPGHTVLPHQTGSRLSLSGFPWGVPIEPPKNKAVKADVELAVVHAYCWTQGHSHPGAAEDKRLPGYAKALKPYTAAIFGDNHIGFMGKAGGCNVLNNGSVIRRSQAERDYAPHVGLLLEDGTWERHPLNTSRDLWAAPTVADFEPTPEFTDCIANIRNLQTIQTNYPDALRQYAGPLSPPARKVLDEVLDG